MRLRRRVLCLSLLPLAWGIGCRKEEGGRRDEGPDRPNIILITIESLRADHVGCYGYRRNTTPNIDALAAQATTYDRAYSVTSWTLTSHASMFTGLYPSAHKVILPKDRLSDAYVTVAEVLSTGGYQCAAVISGPYLRKTLNLNQGFEYYDESVASMKNEEAQKDVTNPRMAEAMERYLREKRDPKRPFFLFAYYWDVHYDYIPPPPYDTMFVPDGAERTESIPFSPIVKLGRNISQNQLDYLVAQYDGEIRCTDEYLGRLWTLLREMNLWDDTVIILTSDHGEQFFEHGRLGHKYDLYVESLHVPLIVKHTRRTKAARESRVVNLIDLCATIIDLAGCDSVQPSNGWSLSAGAPSEDRATFFELKTTWAIHNTITGKRWDIRDDWVAVRQGRHKLVRVLGSDFLRLYDVVDDPGEHNPLGQANESTSAALRGQLERWQLSMKELAKLWEQGPQARFSEEEIRRLRSLGYIQ